VEGATLGKFRLTERIGEGGMGVVYSGTHTVIGRRVAVKLLLPELSSNSEIIDRFFNEARAAAKVQHPGIVDILDFGYADDGSAYIAMEFLNGESLADRIDQAKRVPADDLTRFARQAASALAETHEVGIIHRDLKPDNLFLSPDGDVAGGERVKILDFGIAKLAPSLDSGGVKTRTGNLMGSPTYMSPEQCRGVSDIDARSDIYSLGCVMYEMACGQPPFDGEGVGDIIAKHVYEEPTKINVVQGSTATPALAAVIMKCLAKERDDRYQTMTELVSALDKASSNRFATAPVQPANKPGKAAVRTPTAFDKTTLGGAASEVTLPPADSPRKLWPIAVLAVLVLAVGGVVLAKIGSTDDKAPGQRASKSGTPENSAAGPPTPEKPPAKAATTPPPTATATAKAPQKVTITLKSTPDGATVVDSAGAVQGKTPLPITLDKESGEHSYTLRAQGHKEETVTVATTKTSERTVTMAKLAKHPRASASDRRRRKNRANKLRRKNPKGTKTDPKRQKGDPLDPFAD